MRLAVVIPAHNEEKTIANVIKEIPKKIDGITSTEVVVIDDNSSDATCQIAKKAGAHVLSHAMNLGQGAAVLTGMIFSRRLNVGAVVTLDADGQHDPREIVSLVERHKLTHADLIIGSRFLSNTIKNMPMIKRVGNRSFSLLTYLLSGKMLTDTQSGFRLFGNTMLDLLVSLDLAGYEFCSETIMIAHQNQLLIEEVPISTIYFTHRQGQNPLNGVNILTKLIFRKLTG